MTSRGFYRSFDLDVGAVQTSLTSLPIAADELDDLISRGATSAVDVLQLQDVPEHILHAAREMIARMADHAAEQKRLFDERARAYDADRYSRALTVGRLRELLADLPTDARIYNDSIEDYFFEDTFAITDNKVHL